MGILVLLLIFFVFLAMFGIGLWIGVGKFVHDNRPEIGVSSGVVFFHFLGAALLIFITYHYIVGLDSCKGFLCGLDALFLFMLLASIMFLAWPIILLLYFRKKKANFKQN